VVVVTPRRVNCTLLALLLTRTLGHGRERGWTRLCTRTSGGRLVVCRRRVCTDRRRPTLPLLPCHHRRSRRPPRDIDNNVRARERVYVRAFVRACVYVNEQSEGGRLAVAAASVCGTVGERWSGCAGQSSDGVVEPARYGAHRSATERFTFRPPIASIPRTSRPSAVSPFSR
jgi:hypothetical protein